MSQQNVEIVRTAYAAMSARDFDALTKVTDSDWVFDFSRAIGRRRVSTAASKKSLSSEPPLKKPSKDSNFRRSSSWSDRPARSSCGIT